LPASIVLLLFPAAVVSIGLMGAQQRVSNERRLGETVGFMVLVCMVSLVTLDLNLPQRGSITITQEPLERLLIGMEK
jgi:hypothetical protein